MTVQTAQRIARKIVVSGRVQGVGFRPFAYRLAHHHGLAGHVLNSAGEVIIHVEGEAAALEGFFRGLIDDAPPLSRPKIRSCAEVPPKHVRQFHILPSTAADTPDVHLPPDLFCCDDCLAEMQDPAQRRYRYAFTNCTQCGPRYTIIEGLPYDRSATSMAEFDMCPACRAEYENIDDRRFHAQPLACPDCGPVLRFSGEGDEDQQGEAALAAAVALLQAGGIVAVKGIGGYHLMCDAASDEAVAALRARKRRPDKPLAVMFPQRGADGLDAVREAVRPDEPEARAIADPGRPIVLVRKHEDCWLSPLLAPGLCELGVFLAYSPLHHLLLGDFAAPLVATSGNISGEPVLTDNAEAQARLASVADGFLHHDRPIERPADDTVVRIIGDRQRLIRPGRGVAPLEIELPDALPHPVLAVGGHMKATVALGWGRRAVLSAHIGELDSMRGLAVFEQVIGDLQALYGVEAETIVCDAHPGYASARWARKQDTPVMDVQHHKAHASALAGEYPELSRWLVFAWDGVGYGADGELWGGEAFAGSPGDWHRVGSLRPFRVTGGDLVGREPWRSAAALHWETGMAYTTAARDIDLVRQARDRGVNTLTTSSAGRLFDAASALVLDLDIASYEGQGPMMLESLASDDAQAVGLPLVEDGDGVLRIDWAPLVPLLRDRQIDPSLRAGIFHESLARALAAQAELLSERHDFEAVGLTGGVFQNRRLSERTGALLQERGMTVKMPSRFPANDGGLAFGQIVEFLHVFSDGRRA